MARRYVETCDRCGKELKNSLFRVTGWKFKVLNHFDRNDPYAYTETTYEYCRECGKIIEAALEAAGKE